MLSGAAENTSFPPAAPGSEEDEEASDVLESTVVRIQRLVRARQEKARLQLIRQHEFRGFLSAELDAFGNVSEYGGDSESATSASVSPKHFEGAWQHSPTHSNAAPKQRVTSAEQRTSSDDDAACAPPWMQSTMPLRDTATLFRADEGPQGSATRGPDSPPLRISRSASRVDSGMESVTELFKRASIAGLHSRKMSVMFLESEGPPGSVLEEIEDAPQGMLARSEYPGGNGASTKTTARADGAADSFLHTLPPPLITELLTHAAPSELRGTGAREAAAITEPTVTTPEVLATKATEYFVYIYELLCTEETNHRAECAVREGSGRAALEFNHSLILGEYNESRLRVFAWLLTDAEESERTRRMQIERDQQNGMWSIREAADNISALLPQSPSAALNALYKKVRNRHRNAVLATKIPDLETQSRKRIHHDEEIAWAQRVEEMRTAIQKHDKIQIGLRHCVANETAFRVQWVSEWEAWWGAMLPNHIMEIVLALAQEEGSKRLELRHNEVQARYRVNTQAIIMISRLSRIHQVAQSESDERHLILESAKSALGFIVATMTREQAAATAAVKNLLHREACERMDVQNGEMDSRQQMLRLCVSTEYVLTGGNDKVADYSKTSIVIPAAATEDFSLFSQRPTRGSGAGIAAAAGEPASASGFVNTESIVTSEALYRNRCADYEALSFQWIVGNAVASALSVLRTSEMHRRDFLLQEEGFEYRLLLSQLHSRREEMKLSGALQLALARLEVGRRDTLVIESQASRNAPDTIDQRPLAEESPKRSELGAILESTCLLPVADQFKGRHPNITSPATSLDYAHGDSSPMSGTDTVLIPNYGSADKRSAARVHMRLPPQSESTASLATSSNADDDYSVATESVSPYISVMRRELCRAYRVNEAIEYLMVQRDFIDAVNVMGITLSMEQGAEPHHRHQQPHIWCDRDLYRHVDTLTQRIKCVLPPKKRSFVALAGMHRTAAWLRLDDCCRILLITLYMLHCKQQDVNEVALSDALVEVWTKQFITFGLSRLLRDQTLSHSFVMRSTFELFSAVETRRMPYEPFEALFLDEEEDLADLSLRTNINFHSSIANAVCVSAPVGSVQAGKGEDDAILMERVGVPYLAFALLLRQGSIQFSLPRLQHVVEPMLHPDNVVSASGGTMAAPLILMSFLRRGADCIAAIIGAHGEFSEVLKTVEGELLSDTPASTGTTPAEYIANIVNHTPEDAILQLAARCLLIVIIFSTSLKNYDSEQTSKQAADTQVIEKWAGQVFKIAHAYYRASMRKDTEDIRAVCVDVCIFFYDFFLSRSVQGAIFLRFISAKRLPLAHEVTALQQQVSQDVQERSATSSMTSRSSTASRGMQQWLATQEDGKDISYSAYPGGGKSFARVLSMLNKCLGVLWLAYASELDGAVAFYSRSHFNTTSALDARYFQRVQSDTEDGFGRYEHFQEAIHYAEVFNGIMKGAMGYLQAMWSGSRWMRATVRANTGLDVVNTIAPKTAEEAARALADSILSVWPHQRRERIPLHRVKDHYPPAEGTGESAEGAAPMNASLFSPMASTSEFGELVMEVEGSVTDDGAASRSRNDSREFSNVAGNRYDQKADVLSTIRAASNPSMSSSAAAVHRPSTQMAARNYSSPTVPTVADVVPIVSRLSNARKPGTVKVIKEGVEKLDLSNCSLSLQEL